MSLPKSYICCRAAHPVQITGRMDDPAWENAPWTDDFVDIEGDLQPLPPFKTRMKLLWDDEYLYVGAWMEEPHIWATLTEHDSIIFHDNDFEIFLDPDGDNHEYYEIEINALNTTWDLRLAKPYRDGGPAISEWEVPGMKTAVYIDGTLNDPSDTDRFWSVEMALPWSVLGEYAHRPAPPRDGDQWRVNCSRVEWDLEIVDGAYKKIPDRPEHNWVWSPQGVIDMHRPELWGYVQFSTETTPTASFRPDPSLPARNLLMRVYHAQRAFHKEHGHWAGTLEELSLTDIAPALALRLTDDGYEASLPYTEEGGVTRRVHVRADSRLWEDGKTSIGVSPQ